MVVIGARGSGSAIGPGQRLQRARRGRVVADLCAQRVQELLVKRLLHDDGLHVANVAIQAALQHAIVAREQADV